MIEACTVDGCDKPSRGARLCPMHYERMRRHGTLDGLHPQGSPFERLMRNVRKIPGGCWLYEGKATKNGYATVGAGGKDGGSIYGHRLVYETLVGPIPPETPRLHHTCETRRCVNPDHLVPSSARSHAHEHGLGGDTCQRCGFSDWYVRKDTGARWCRECRRRNRRNGGW